MKFRNKSDVVNFNDRPVAMYIPLNYYSGLA
jgi:hypothetical protein